MARLHVSSNFGVNKSTDSEAGNFVDGRSLVSRVTSHARVSKCGTKVVEVVCVSIGGVWRDLQGGLYSTVEYRG